MQPPDLPGNEEERLKSLYVTGLLDTRDDERFERLTRLARRVFQVPVALISLLDRDRQWLLACEGLGIRETPVTSRSADMPFCMRGLSSFLMQQPISGSTTIPWSPVSPISGSMQDSRLACLTARWPARCA